MSLRGARVGTIALAMVFIALSGLSAEGSKIALLVGNGDYQNYVDLENPRGDVAAVSARLQGLGFEVTTLLDAARIEFESGLGAFADKLRADPESVGLFYYAGHAVQAEGRQYLIPADANPPSASSLAETAIPLDALLGKLIAAGNRKSYAILDAELGLFAATLARGLAEGADLDACFDSAARELAEATVGKQSPALFWRSPGEESPPASPSAAAVAAGAAPKAERPVAAEKPPAPAQEAEEPAAPEPAEQAALQPTPAVVQRGPKKDLDLTLLAGTWKPLYAGSMYGAFADARLALTSWLQLGVQTGIYVYSNWQSLEETAADEDQYGGKRLFYLTAGPVLRAPFKVLSPYFSAQIGLGVLTNRHYSAEAQEAVDSSGVSGCATGALGFSLALFRGWGLDFAAEINALFNGDGEVGLTLGLSYSFD